MIIKKFTAKTEKEATEAAKKELGDGVVIMNVRTVKKYGFLSFLRPQQVEVTVALEDEAERGGSTVTPFGDTLELYRDRDERPKATGMQIAKAASAGTIPPLKVSPEPPVPEEEEHYEPSEEAKHMQQSLAEKRLKSDGAPFSQTVKPQRKEDAGLSNSSVIEEKIDNLRDLLEQKTIRTDSNEKTPEEAKKEKDASAEQEKTAQEKASEETLTFVKTLYNTLLQNEVDERFANQLTDEIEKINTPGLPLEYALSNVYQKMVLKFGKPETIGDNDGKVRAEIFIGPTGVGKTTTIAKLASELCIVQKKKVALLTVDTYRIAAAEQLKTYASILNIPFKVIYSTDEMKAAIEEFRDYDYLMLDTTGHSISNKEQLDNTMSFLHTVVDKIDADIFLVLSASTKYRDLLEIADAYADMVKYKLIFTKMDETGAAGNLYNLRMHTNAPMSYITNGQNVPDDIAVFDAQQVVRGLLG